MRIVFAGTPGFAVSALEALVDAGHEIPLVLTQPDRPAGRGMTVAESPVKATATRRGLPVYQPATLRSDTAQGQLRRARPDLLVVAAYGLILPQAVLDIPPLGALNIHASLLPRWRGAAPIQRALLAGDSVTGVCIMRMEAGLDTGPVLLRESIPIAPRETAGTLHDKLAAIGARLIVEAAAQLAAGHLEAVPQPAEGVTYAPKIDKAEARIDWARPAVEIDRQVRAFDPFPGAVTKLGDVDLKIWAMSVGPGVDARPGTVAAVDDRGITIACGQGSAVVESLQRAGGKRLPAHEFLRGTAVRPGDRLGS